MTAHVSLLTLCLGVALSCGYTLGGARLPQRRVARSPAAASVLPAECGENGALLRLLRAAGSDREPTRVSELTAGFCNWVYLVELAAPLQGESSVVVKLFSPLAKLRLTPPEVRVPRDDSSATHAHPFLYLAIYIHRCFIRGSTEPSEVQALLPLHAVRLPFLFSSSFVPARCPSHRGGRATSTNLAPTSARPPGLDLCTAPTLCVCVPFPLPHQ